MQLIAITIHRNLLQAKIFGGILGGINHQQTLFMPLTNLQVKNASYDPDPKVSDRLPDQHGLYLLLKENGSKLWRFKYRIAGKEGL